jgi:hypothetical protein
MMRRLMMALAIVASIAVVAAGKADSDDSDLRAPVKLAVDGDVIPWRRMSVFMLPGETVDIRIDEQRPVHEYALRSEHGVVRQLTPRRWRWEAPAETGTVTLELEPVGAHHDHEKIELRAWVMVPRSRVVRGSLNGFRIGDYPIKPLKNNPIYKPPPGFIEVTKKNEDERLSPHFKLKQFLVKQQASEWPKYVIVQTRLLLKLEEVLARVRRSGYDVNTLHVMSAYRTPWYNRAIGNETTYSQHLWGSAADVFVDDNGDGTMDDLNGDKRIDREDATVLMGMVVDVERTSRELVGGLGAYPATNAHGPFVHLDVRGTPARW